MTGSEFVALPQALTERASVRGNEYAWPLSDIPAVIDAVEQANLVSIGGQLQFRFPDAICECYWVQVDTAEYVEAPFSWSEKVSRSAADARVQFASLHERFDFLAEGRSGFQHVFEDFERAGVHVESCIAFVWYASAKDG